MCTLAGPDASVAFTHISSAAAAALPLAFAEERAGSRARTTKPHGAPGLAPSRSDSDAGAFAWFLFGGIPGDDLPRDRTARSVPGAPFGPRADDDGYSSAVTKRVVVDRGLRTVPLDEIPYVDHPAIRFNTRESVEMPFRASDLYPLTMDMTPSQSPSCAASPISHIHLRSATTPSTSASTKPPNPATHAPRDVPSFDIVCEERLLRDIVEEALA
ncbi:hypothetical protein EDB83DRAFT_2514286 [Lactarius deliciosus]|nr:hypothetical protein EDB83DRAFT_2514286 [Lactarius deliciosus]